MNFIIETLLSWFVCLPLEITTDPLVGWLLEG